MAVSISQLAELTSILDDDVFPITAVRSTKSTGKIKYRTIKQSILDSVPIPVIDWSGITNKPFTSIGDGLSVDTNGILSASGLDFATLSGMIVQGTNMSIITDSNAKTITFNATGGIDFDALATAMTTGTQSGITVTADSTNNRFNFEVTGISAVVTDMGYGANITITDSNGTTTVDIYDGTDGVSPHIDGTTGHWFVGETDTGVSATAGIDDTSTTGTDVSWSASKINSVLGDINTILASVTGGIS